ncbi:AAA family ATPase [Nostoc sp.]|uniref:AAA family ATPase n=1 Tax=Nostoc sp. TaxID=1180 RepID=UPI002FF7575B
MRIKQISVSGLFGIFDHVIPLNMDERITIIHGPNGFGKTAMLRILNSLFNSQYSELRTIPFKDFRVAFDDSSSIEIIKNTEKSEEVEKNNIFQIQPQDIDESTKNALSVYIQDVEKKLSVFAEIASNHIDATLATT